ncbi:MAG: transposase [Bacteroidota bacterium]
MRYNPNIHHRKSTRLKGWDYSEPEGYFVTICTKNREWFFGEVVDGKMRLSEAGRIADECWREIPDHFPNVSADVYQIMPDHVHGIVQIQKRSAILSGGRGLINQAPTTRRDQSLSGKSEWILMKQEGILLGKIIRSFKAQSTRLIHATGDNSFAWQRNYHDHIIRDTVEHLLIKRYIALNPQRWDRKEQDRRNERSRYPCRKGSSQYPP